MNGRKAKCRSKTQKRLKGTLFNQTKQNRMEIFEGILSYARIQMAANK